MPHSVSFHNSVQKCMPALSLARLKTFLLPLSWGEQTSSFCWCQRYAWHTTACLRKPHWKDQCVFSYLGLSDRMTRVVVRSCLVMMHRLCAAVCCHSTSISICTGKATMLQQGRGDITPQHNEMSGNSEVSSIIFGDNQNIFLISICEKEQFCCHSQW